MYVTNMREGDVLRIGDDIQICVRRVKSGWTKIAVEAPREVKIERLPELEPVSAEDRRPTISDVILRRQRAERR